MYQVWNASNVVMKSFRHSGFARIADLDACEMLNPKASRAPSQLTNKFFDRERQK
jgi:hypothetical protein